MRRAILEKFRAGSKARLDIVAFQGHVKGTTFPTQVANLSLNRNAKGHVGKVWGRVKGLLGHVDFSWPCQGEHISHSGSQPEP
jgi:hypothetical protein